MMHGAWQETDLLLAPLVTRKDNDRLLAFKHSLPQEGRHAAAYSSASFTHKTDVRPMRRKVFSKHTAYCRGSHVCNLDDEILWSTAEWNGMPTEILLTGTKACSSTSTSRPSPGGASFCGGGGGGGAPAPAHKAREPTGATLPCLPLEKNGELRGGSIWPFIMPPPLVKDAGTTEKERTGLPPLTAPADAHLRAPPTTLFIFPVRSPKKIAKIRPSPRRGGL
jgi:hypothetical protein